MKRLLAAFYFLCFTRAHIVFSFRARILFSLHIYYYEFYYSILLFLLLFVNIVTLVLLL